MAVRLRWSRSSSQSRLCLLVTIMAPRPTLYMVHPSPPVRSVLITAKAIGLDLIEKELNLANGDHLKPEFLKVNPQHTVPTLVEENGFAIWDSHAIMTYIVGKYGNNDSLYPKDLNKRAVVDQRLHFESGVVFPRVLKISGEVFRKGKATIDEDDTVSANEVYKFLEAFLDGRLWIAGDSLTVADYSLIGSISTLNLFVPIDVSRYPRVSAWLKKAEQLPEYEANRKGLEMCREMLKNKMKQVH